MLPTSLRTPSEIGAFVKERRRVLGLDQAELAQRVGVSRLWIGQVEHGKPGVGLGLVLRTLAALDVELQGIVPSETFTETAPRPAPVFTPDLDAIIAAARGRERR